MQRKSSGVKSGDLGGHAVGHSACNTSRGDKHVAYYALPSAQIQFTRHEFEYTE